MTRRVGLVVLLECVLIFAYDMPLPTGFAVQGITESIAVSVCHEKVVQVERVLVGSGGLLGQPSKQCWNLSGSLLDTCFVATEPSN